MFYTIVYYFECTVINTSEGTRSKYTVKSAIRNLIDIHQEMKWAAFVEWILCISSASSGGALKLYFASLSTILKDAVNNMSKTTRCLVTDSNWPPPGNKSSEAPFETIRSVLYKPFQFTTLSREWIYCIFTVSATKWRCMLINLIINYRVHTGNEVVVCMPNENRLKGKLW